MTSAPDLTTRDPSSYLPVPSRGPKAAALVLASVAILLPGAMAAMTHLPLPVRGGSAILGGLAVLLCGSYLFSHVLLRWAQGTIPSPSK